MKKKDDEIKKAIGQMDPIRRSVMMACDAGDLPLIQVLIEGGGDVNTADEKGFTILMGACKNGYIDVVNYLIEKGADIHATDINGMTAYQFAKQAGQEEIIKILDTIQHKD